MVVSGERMKRMIVAAIAACVVSGCVSASVYPDPAKHYLVEAAAREMPVQHDVGLLYVMQEQKGHDFVGFLSIDQEKEVIYWSSSDFMVFCLPPGRHSIEYDANDFTISQKEVLQIKAGEIYARQVRRSWPSLYIDNLSLGSAKSMVESRRLDSPKSSYAASRFSCRSLETSQK